MRVVSKMVGPKPHGPWTNWKGHHWVRESDGAVWTKPLPKMKIQPTNVGPRPNHTGTLGTWDWLGIEHSGVIQFVQGRRDPASPQRGLGITGIIGGAADTGQKHTVKLAATFCRNHAGITRNQESQPPPPRKILKIHDSDSCLTP